MTTLHIKSQTMYIWIRRLNMCSSLAYNTNIVCAKWVQTLQQTSATTSLFAVLVLVINHLNQPQESFLHIPTSFSTGIKQLQTVVFGKFLSIFFTNHPLFLGHVTLVRHKYHLHIGSTMLCIGDRKWVDKETCSEQICLPIQKQALESQHACNNVSFLGTSLSILNMGRGKVWK